MNSWTVYILRCADESLYTGITTDLERRLAQHNAGTAAKYTRAKGPCDLVWSKNGFTESSAKSEEYRIKQLTKAKKEDLLRI